MKIIILLNFVHVFCLTLTLDDYLTDCWGNKCRDNEKFLQKMAVDQLNPNKYVHISYKTFESGLIVFGPVIPFEGTRYCMIYVDNGKTYKECEQTRVFNNNSFDKGNCIFSPNTYENGYQIESRRGRMPVRVSFDGVYYYGYFDKYTNCVSFPDVYNYRANVMSLQRLEQYITYLHCRN
uniref:DUF3421 domain-containing protein n=1 Tax=Strongyloides venezuelensis TaxID=75913 RepID=A0A0K0G4K5_STRVS